ncbi:hypothetical protein, partial [uncultured Oscillibacter sp.]|uniref:hypothetical protein n=1 Tax=uncultured Oscillibacter sp. TaxID=876091 RepID=UPI00261EA356
NLAAVQTNIELFVIASSIFSVAAFGRIDHSLLTHNLGASTVISHSKSSVWCFLFVTLFNLQGTRLLGGTFAILAHSQALVKPFFKSFFDSQGPDQPSCLTALLEYQMPHRLSTPFFKFLRFL